ncbi:MAG: hypothetical protein V3V25_01980 [Paracoccaceae bacterium]
MAVRGFMQVAIHLGVHCTDEDRLLKTLLQNKGALAKLGISVPGPGRYRKSVTREAQRLRGFPTDHDSRDLLVDSIVDDDSASRMILTFENFLCDPARVFENGLLYDQSGSRPKNLQNLFLDLPVEFFISIRNPATFVPAIFHHKDQMISDFKAFLDGVDLEDIRWSDVIAAIKENCPDCPITVWCNEDTPLIWPEIVHQVTGCPKMDELLGGNNVLASIMKNEGLDRMQTYLESHPPRNEGQRRRIILAFLDKYAIADAVEEELDVPGWSDELVKVLTQNYEADLEEISQMQGVNLISP